MHEASAPLSRCWHAGVVAARHYVLLMRFADRTDGQYARVVPEQYLPEAWLGFPHSGAWRHSDRHCAALTGVLAANFVGRSVVGGWESLMERIPIVRSIYSAAKNFAEIVFSDSRQSFKQGAADRIPAQGPVQPAFQTASDLARSRDALVRMSSAVSCRLRRIRRRASSSLCRRKM